MAKTKIQWVEYVFNPWWGCVQISPACDHCYAMVLARRIGRRLFGHPVEWGPGGQRGYAGDARWAEPLAWQRKAAAQGARHRVFCGSMMDVFEGLREQRPYLERLYELIERTPNLDWLLLTKRPNNIAKLGPSSWPRNVWPRNVWLGSTLENQEWAEQRLPHLLQHDCAVRFASVEPMLGPLDLRRVLGPGRGQLNWVIFGGESGVQARGPADAVRWYRDLRDQCQAAGVPLFFKQWGTFRQDAEQLIKLKPRDARPGRDEPALLDGVIWQQVPAPR
jgi:protein gp37